MPTKYKDDFVNFVAAIEWDWFITIPVGSCPPDDEVLRRLRRIEAEFNKKFVCARYHKLSDADRFIMAVAFEGERTCGSRHAHVLVRIPNGRKKRLSREMLVAQFPLDFRLEWSRFSRGQDLWIRRKAPWEAEFEYEPVVSIARANVARAVYTAKDVRERDVPWSRFEFVTPPKFGIFYNENLRGIKNRDRQKRLALGLR